MYTIGLIDDEKTELSKIRRTIKTNSNIPEEQFSFKSYDIPNIPDGAVAELCEVVLKDIIESQITGLIVDYKIMVSASKIKGTDILEKIKDSIEQFPIIVLTEVVSESIMPLFVDPDKVYEKNLFFRIEDEYSKTKVQHIFDNMKKYTEQRDSLIVRLDELKEKLSKGDRAVIKDILAVERRLDRFLPVNQMPFDWIYDENKISKIMKMVDEIDKKLE